SVLGFSLKMGYVRTLGLEFRCFILLSWFMSKNRIKTMIIFFFSGGSGHTISDRFLVQSVLPIWIYLIGDYGFIVMKEPPHGRLLQW
ncbi:hypothetical protein C3F00_034830, partial [Pseudomonas sp. MWU13-2860]